MEPWTRLVERRQWRQRKGPRFEKGRRQHAYVLRKYYKLETGTVVELGETMASTPGIEEEQAASASRLMLFKFTREGKIPLAYQHPPSPSSIGIDTSIVKYSSSVATHQTKN